MNAKAIKMQIHMADWIEMKSKALPCFSFVVGHDFCAEGVLCGENSVCKNRNNKAECECKSGYASIHGDSTYCEGKTDLVTTQRCSNMK